MKNLTVSVPEDVYRRARIRAAERGSSVSALVTEFLSSLSDGEFKRLEAQQERVMAEIGEFSGADRLPREEIHDRAVR